MQNLINKRWNNYVEITPSAWHIKQVLCEQSEIVFNDHITFRSIKSINGGMEAVAQPFLDMGYEVI